MGNDNMLAQGDAVIGGNLRVGGRSGRNSSGTQFPPATGMVTVNPASINSVTRGATNVTITGVRVGDYIHFQPPANLHDDLLYVGAEITADDTATVYLYNPTGGAINWDPVNEQQVLTRSSTGGTITLTFGGQTTATIPASAAGFTAAATEAALEGLDNLAPADVSVSGSAGGPLTVTFAGAWAAQDLPLMTVDNTLATGGTIVPTEGVKGQAQTWRYFWMDMT